MLLCACVQYRKTRILSMMMPFTMLHPVTLLSPSGHAAPQIALSNVVRHDAPPPSAVIFSCHPSRLVTLEEYLDCR